MVEEYFRRQQDSLLNDKLNLEKEYTRIVNQIIETDKFIELLEEKSDPNFESFTPREVNVKNRSEIKNLQEAKKRLKEEKNSLKDRLDECRGKIEEFQTFLHSMRDEKTKIDEERRANEKNVMSKLDILQYVSREKVNFSLGVVETVLQPIIEFNQKVKLINQFMDVDRERAKLELQQLNTSIISIEKNVNDFISYNSMLRESLNFNDELEKFIDDYNKRHDDILNVVCEVDDINVIMEPYVFSAILCIMKNVIIDFEKIRSKMKVKRNTIDKTDKCKYEIQVECKNIEQVNEIKDTLLTNEKINLYTYLLEIVPQYSYENTGLFCISFEY